MIRPLAALVLLFLLLAAPAAAGAPQAWLGSWCYCVDGDTICEAWLAERVPDVPPERVDFTDVMREVVHRIQAEGYRFDYSRVPLRMTIEPFDRDWVVLHFEPRLPDDCFHD